MRKYRSGTFSFLPGNPISLKNMNFVYLFVTWNLLAFCGYQWYIKKNIKDKDKWKQMTACKYSLLNVAKHIGCNIWLGRSFMVTLPVYTLCSEETPTHIFFQNESSWTSPSHNYSPRTPLENFTLTDMHIICAFLYTAVSFFDFQTL